MTSSESQSFKWHRFTVSDQWKAQGHQQQGDRRGLHPVAGDDDLDLP